MNISEYQARASLWCRECFGEMTLMDKQERVLRLLEESLELAQALGAQPIDVIATANYVFSRPSGEPRQELGGLMTVLSALATAHRMDISNEALTELNRIEQPEMMEKIRAKHAAKARRSPLPPDYKHAGT